MKLLNLFVFLFLCAAYFLSCQKEFLCPDCNIKKPPDSNAGIDQIIILPTDSVLLDGNLSKDPDGKIVSYQWTKISGPSSSLIINSTSAQASVKNLTQGVYQFELTVIDNDGLSSKDTIQIKVNIVVSGNKPPVAMAGDDITIQVQTSCSIVPITATLYGNLSFDVDGIIISYLWTGNGIIADPNSAITQVTNLAPGGNMFVLKVTDNNGAIGLDTVLIQVIETPRNTVIIPARLIPIGTLSQTRTDIAVAAAGNKILFAGGQLIPANKSPSTSRVDIYDIVTNTWSKTELSEGRFSIGVATLGDKIFFAGGGIQQNNGAGEWLYNGTASSAVDIFDALTNTWNISKLSNARIPVGSSAGNKVVFAGGDNRYPSASVDIYDGANNSWSTSSISEPRHISQAATDGSKIFFAGGSVNVSNSGGHVSKQVDIYDASLNKWSIDTLHVARGEMGAITAGNKVYYGGGNIWNSSLNTWGLSSSVEIKDLITNSVTYECLSEAKDGITAIRKDNKIIFFGGSYYGVFKARFDIYDLNTHSWSIGELPQNLVSASIISYNNIIYIAGGTVNGIVSNQVWKLDF
jgi:Uncharacterized protein conserved in bacteria